VPLPYLREVARYAEGARPLPLHMHVAEQPAEVAACLEEHGRTPVELLDAEGLLGENFTGVHAIHITAAEARALARQRASVCACPTTERNLGDGVVPADLLFAEGVNVSLGTDSHAQIDLLEDARELEYHLRLQKLERAVLAPGGDESLSGLAARLFECATAGGARSLNSPGGGLEAGRAADFFTVDLEDPSIAGAAGEDLLASVVFGLARTAVKEVYVAGRQIVADGRHAAAQEITERFAALQRRLWG
jgi:formimidoylglutamate deiminase